MHPGGTFPVPQEGFRPLKRDTEGLARGRLQECDTYSWEVQQKEGEGGAHGAASEHRVALVTPCEQELVELLLPGQHLARTAARSSSTLR